MRGVKTDRLDEMQQSIEKTRVALTRATLRKSNYIEKARGGRQNSLWAALARHLDGSCVILRGSSVIFGQVGAITAQSFVAKPLGTVSVGAPRPKIDVLGASGPRFWKPESLKTRFRSHLQKHRENAARPHRIPRYARLFF